MIAAQPDLRAMIHPLLRLVATQPHLLVDHAQAYVELASEELGKTATVWKWRVALTVVALCLLGVAAVLGGVALMLWAVIPSASIHAPWALFAGPLVPAGIAFGCLIKARQHPQGSFDALKQQIRADLLMVREVSNV